MTIHYCFTEDETCPYYNPKTGFCSIDDPLENCDDYAFYNAEELEEREAARLREWNEWGPFASYDPD